MAGNPLLDLQYSGEGPDPGADEIYTTADVLRGIKPESGLTHAMRSGAEGLRWLAKGPEDVPTNGKLVPFVLNAAGGGLDTMANWLDRRPEVGKDTLAPLGLAAMAPATAVHGAAGVFGGRLAKTADHEALARAELMHQAGFPRESIWSDTGWFQGHDGKWRFEIDDSNAVVPFPTQEAVTNKGGVAGSAFQSGLNHQPLLDAYPGMRRTDWMIAKANSPEGKYASGKLDAPEFIGVQGPTTSDHRSVFLHEAQHGIQSREDFARGTSPDALYLDPTFPKFAEAEKLAALYGLEWEHLLKPQKRALTDEVLMDAYRRTAGEVEARNVQTRRNMAPDERRRTPPWETQDVADADQILRADQQRASLPGLVVEGLDPTNGRIRAYHGTGADFDRFDFSKIGSGEGNQVYGHGLYFAEEPKVAADYRKKLGGDSNAYLEYLVKTPHGTELTIPGRGKDLPEGIAPELHHAANLFFHDGKRKAQAYTKQWLADAQEGKGINPDRPLDYWQKLHDYVRQMRPGDVEAKRGRTYEVDLKANPEQFLDWDLPLKRQSGEVRDALLPFAQERADISNQARARLLDRGTDAFGKPLPPERIIDLSQRTNPEAMTGQGLYKSLEVSLGGQRPGDKAPDASAKLQEWGIPGVRYWDQASRSKKSGTSNYVMFPGTEDLIEILRKYGLAGPVAGGAVSGAMRDSSSPDAGQ